MLRMDRLKNEAKERKSWAGDEVPETFAGFLSETLMATLIRLSKPDEFFKLALQEWYKTHNKAKASEE